MMISTKFISIFLIAGLLCRGSSAACPLVCPDGWIKIPMSMTDHCYLKPPVPIPVNDFWSIQNYCTSKQPTSYIITFNTPMEMGGAGVEAFTYLLPYMKAMGSFFAWIGAYYMNGAWHWLDGQPFGSFNLIVPKILDPSKNGSCLSVDPMKLTFAGWVYRDCSDMKGATACEMSPVADCSATPPPPETTAPYKLPDCEKEIWGDFAESLSPGYLNIADELQYLEGQTKISCGSACIYYTGCISFDFDSESGDCRLLQASSQYTCNFNDKASDGKWQHYDLVASSVYNAQGY